MFLKQQGMDLCVYICIDLPLSHETSLLPVQHHSILISLLRQMFKRAFAFLLMNEYKCEIFFVCVYEEMLVM